MILLIGFVVLAGRVAMAGASVTAIAGDASREASLTRDPRAAVVAASSSARAALADQNLHCSGGGTVTVDASGFAAASAGAAGQSVMVTVTCLVSFSDVGFPGLPGTRALTDRGVSPLDPNRSTTTGLLT